MAEFTKGKWAYNPPPKYCSKEGLKDCHIFSLQGNIAHFIGTVSTEEDARLIAAAPEMYRLLEVWTQIQAQPTLRNAQNSARELLARIDGKEDNS